MRTIYIVEDDEDIRDLIVYALENAGFACKGYEEGAGLFADLNQSAPLPDLILLDIMLPG